MPRRVGPAARVILPIPNIQCMGCCGDVAVVGNDMGDLYAFSMHTPEPVVLAHVQAHDGPLTALLCYRLVEPTNDEFMQVVSTQHDAMATNVLVSHLAFTRVVTASSDGSLREWRLLRSSANGPLEFRQVKSLRLHEDAITSLAINPAGKVFSSSLDGTVRSWELGTGSYKLTEAFEARVTTIACWETKVFCGLEVWARCFVSVRLIGAAGWASGSLPCQRWPKEASAGPHAQSELYSSECCLCSLCPLNALVQMLPTDLLASASDDGSVRLWQIDTLECINVLWGSHGPISALVSEHTAPCAS